MSVDAVGGHYTTGKYDDNLNDKRTNQEVRDELNEMFCTVTTWEELCDFFDYMNSFGRGYWLKMTTKKGGELNGMFRSDDERVIYITDQTFIEYTCKIKNLHRVMRVY